MDPDQAAEQYADGIICYRETTPRAHHHTVTKAFLAGVQWAKEHELVGNGRSELYLLQDRQPE